MASLAQGSSLCKASLVLAEVLRLTPKHPPHVPAPGLNQDGRTAGQKDGLAASGILPSHSVFPAKNWREKRNNNTHTEPPGVGVSSCGLAGALCRSEERSQQEVLGSSFTFHRASPTGATASARRPEGETLGVKAAARLGTPLLPPHWPGASLCDQQTVGRRGRVGPRRHPRSRSCRWPGPGLLLGLHGMGSRRGNHPLRLR